MVSLKSRLHLPEGMDDPALPPDIYERCLADLARVNAATRTHQPTLAWLDRAVALCPPGNTVAILDVACGRGDLLRRVAARARRWNCPVRLSGIDLNGRATLAALAAGGPISYHTGDVFAHAPAPPPDFVVSSQFTHHLADPDVVRFLRWLEGNARRGWFISDLRRSRFGYWGFPVLARAARWHPIVRRDGQASVARAFRRADWLRLLAEAGVPDARIERHPFSRLSVGRLK